MILKINSRFCKCLFALFLLWLVSSASQAKTWFVSGNGRDANIGSEKSPFKTISKASEMALPGDTVLVMEGSYRERVAPPRGGEPGRPIVYMAQPGHKVYIKGSDVWNPEWQKDGKGILFARPDDSLFTDDVYFDNANPFKVDLSSTPHGRNGFREFPDIFGSVKYCLGQIFVDGSMWKQVPLKDEMKAEHHSWWYDRSNGNIYMNTGDLGDLSGHKVEITTRRRVFAPHKRGLGYIHLIGFIIEHCGNQFPEGFWSKKENAQAGAVGTRQGHHWLIKNNVIRFANSIGIDCGSEGVDNERNTGPTPELGSTIIEAFKGITGTIIEDNFIVDNGSNGIMSHGVFNLIIRGNVILRNNNLRFMGDGRYEQAGIKLHFAEKALIKGNYIADNYAFGLWLDNQWPDSRVTGNFIANNERSGIFLELTDYPFDKIIIDNNILLGNIENALYAHDASGATFVNNLFANTPGRRDFPEYGQTFFIRQTGPRNGLAKSYHFSFYNNIQIGSRDVFSINYPAYLSGEQRFDGNVYDAEENNCAFIINPASGTDDLLKNDTLITLILSDIGDPKIPTAAVKKGCNANLIFNQWQRFWKKHSSYFDQNSILSTGNIVSYNPTNFEMKIYIDFNPASLKTIKYPILDCDYFGNAVNQILTPGPFLNLKKGMNRFIVWDGRKSIIENIYTGQNNSGKKPNEF